jgi:hypothetical protein
VGLDLPAAVVLELVVVRAVGGEVLLAGVAVGPGLDVVEGGGNRQCMSRARTSSANPAGGASRRTPGRAHWASTPPGTTDAQVVDLGVRGVEVPGIEPGSSVA